MKMLSAGRVSLLGVVLVSVGVSDAVRETLTVSEGGVDFTVVNFSDDRNRPHRLRFRQDGILSQYTFNRREEVTTVRVGAERYTINYDDGDLESVELTSSSRRALLAHDERDSSAIVGRRLDFDSCAVCEEAYDAVCEGVLSVCDLEDFGNPFSAEAAASVDIACGTFGSACSRFEASVACRDQCTPEEVGGGGGGGGSSSNSCLDPTSADFKCTFSGDTTIEFTDCDLTDDDVPFLPACFEEFGRANIERLLLDNGFEVTSYPDDTFTGLSELTFLDLFSNALVTVSEGLFDGLTKLEVLDIASNNLVSLPEGAFSDLERLQTLRIFNNELTPETLPLGLFSGTPQLRELFLDGNNLRDLTGLVGLFDGLTELVDLGLGENGIVTLPEGLFAGLTKLEDLSFFLNGINNLPDGVFDGLTALRTLDLTGNNLTGFGDSLSGITGLRSLLVSFNDLVLTEDSFTGLVNLDNLALEGSRLTTLPAGVFSPLVNLDRLVLFDNEDLQCLPSSTATNVLLDSEDIREGTCECTPVEAVSCADGLTCQSGMAGFTCVAE